MILIDSLLGCTIVPKYLHITALLFEATNLKLKTIYQLMLQYIIKILLIV